MAQRQPSLGGDSIWDDPAFSTSEFQDSMTAESPWGTSALNDFTNFADYGDSPVALNNLRTPSKTDFDAFGNSIANQQAFPGAGSTPAESSSLDSASDSSSQRKRKTTESPISDPVTDGGMRSGPMKSEGMGTAPNNYQGSLYQQTYNQSVPNLAMDETIMSNNDVFTFNSNASSPNLPRDFNQQLVLDGKMTLPTTQPQYVRGPPVSTINPNMFSLGAASRDQSPVTNTTMFNSASPNAIFSTPSSDSNDAYNAGPNWNPSQLPEWPNNFNTQFASPNGLNYTPSPAATNGGNANVAQRAPGPTSRSRLHISPVSTKSRVETQINVLMTLETPPPNLQYLHLPLQTIAKSKLLSKDDIDPATTLELHTMLVCTSAMHNPAYKEKALARAANQNNEAIQKHAEEQRQVPDEEKNSMKDVDEADKCANGGEVKICTNCIQRERKRAGRKKLKKEEEQAHWERFETERIVVFNSNEHLPFKPFESSLQPPREGGMGTTDEPQYIAPEGAMSVSAAMRVACYCRHQSEKEGFQVIFTMKDQQGNVVAQEMSDSILITDDHKTHGPTLTTMASDMLYQQPAQYATHGLPTSYSMVNLPSHTHPFTSSRSTGNLQALAYGDQYNPQSHVHQLQTNHPYSSQTTSATMTPTNLSRPGSPIGAGQQGPNKKRKSSNFGVPAQHRRLPSGLQMTPRVDSGIQPPPSAGSQSGFNYFPSSAAFPQQNDQSFMRIPQGNGPAQFYGSGPPTPASEQATFTFGQPHQLDIARAQNASAYFSHPSSAVPSRSNSPILQQRQYRQPVQQQIPQQQLPQQVQQPLPNHVSHPSQQIFGGQSQQAPIPQQQQQPHTIPQQQQQPQQPHHDATTTPTIVKVTPSEGPAGGGTEVSIFGYNFSHGTQIFFGPSSAPTTFYGPQCILAVSPPNSAGPVPVRLTNNSGAVQPGNANFVYTAGVDGFGGSGGAKGPGGGDGERQMMEMALRYLAMERTGSGEGWQQYANEVAQQFMQTRISQPQGQQQIPGAPQGYDGLSQVQQGYEGQLQGQLQGQQGYDGVHGAGAPGPGGMM